MWLMTSSVDVQFRRRVLQAGARSLSVFVFINKLCCVFIREGGGAWGDGGNENWLNKTGRRIRLKKNPLYNLIITFLVIRIMVVVMIMY